MPTYTDAQYVNNAFGQTVSISVLIDGVQSFVPIDERNTDYQNIMQLVSEGKLVIAPA